MLIMISQKIEEITKFGIKIGIDGAGITSNDSIQVSLWDLHRKSHVGLR